MEDAGTSEEEDIDSQDSNTPIDHGHLAWNCSIKIITPAVKASVISSKQALTQMVAYLPLVQQVRGSIPGGVINFHLKIFNLGARRGGDVHFLIARLYITVLD